MALADITSQDIGLDGMHFPTSSVPIASGGEMDGTAPTTNYISNLVDLSIDLFIEQFNGSRGV
jgi:hypothetical protein